MNVKFYQSDDYVCGYIRGELPARIINRDYSDVRVDSKMNMSLSDCFRTDVMVFQRCNDRGSLSFLRETQRRGVSCIYDLDDNFFCVDPKFIAAHALFTHPEVAQTVRSFVTEATAITVSTYELALAVREQTPKPIFIIDNGVDNGEWAESRAQRGVRRAKNSEVKTIGWMASECHLADIPVIDGPVSAILREYPEITLQIVGSLRKEHFTGCALGGMLDRISFIPWLHISKLPEIMGNFDIAISPLLDTPYNRGKSQIKFLQYSMLGVAGIYSDISTYQNRFISGVEGWLAGPDDWYSCLKRLIDDTPHRNLMEQLAWSRAYPQNVERMAATIVTSWRQIREEDLRRFSLQSSPQ